MRQALAPAIVTATPPAARGLDEAAKRAFLRMISHELRTPLNAIIGFSEVIRQELCGPLGSDQYREYAAYIGTSGHKMLTLVNQIVEIVRLENGAAELDLRAEPLEHLVDEVFQALKPEAQAWGVTLSAEDPQAMPWVQADARALKTVLTNLLQNALAHSPKGGTVAVRAERAGGGVVIAVSDQGPGVDAHEIPRLMQPFQHGEPSLAREADGAGLGLPIAQLLSQAMNGDLELTSAPGQGLTAMVRLPAA